ncbi:hypothetical protein AAMO2058_000320700 [Amorphochlora amoebiformis]
MPEAKGETMLYSSKESDKDILFFDQTVGALEEILMDAKFNKLQSDFLDKNCEQFDDSKECKLTYTEIFKQYVSMIEGVVEKEVKARVQGYSSERFMAMLKDRPDEISGDVFDMLMSMGDFEEFRGLMLAHKAARGKKGLEIKSSLSLKVSA